NLVELYENSVKKFADRPLFGTKNESGTYDWISYREFGRRVDNLRGSLARLGIGKDDVVGIIANNRVEWAVAHFATLGLGGRFVPMYEVELPHVWEYIIRDSGVKVLFVSKKDILEKIKEFPSQIPTLQKIILIEGSGRDTMEELEKIGEGNPVPAVHPHPDEIAVLIYTSGTTGDPKGVLLSHANWTSNSHARVKVLHGVDENDRTLSLLPWAHTYGQGEMHTFLSLGASMGFMESPATIVDDMAQVKPTFLLAVPRVFNRIYDTLWTKMNDEGGLAKTLFIMGVEAVKEKRKLAAQGKSSFLTNLKFSIADIIVFKKIRDKFGGRLKGAVTASAMMNLDIALFFFDIGIPVYDCYGMTETSPAIALNAPLDYRLGSVGKAIDKVRIVIDKSVVEEGAQDGEIVVYGPNVMKGYHNKPEQTREIMTPDGGVRTGDRGRFDEDGYLYITGRIKEQFKLENGKFVFPATLEEDICLVHYVQNAVICGDNRPYTVSLVVPDFSALEKYAEKNNLPRDTDELLKRSDIQEMIGSEIQNFLRRKYASYEIPKKFLFLKEPFSLENGTLTQTLKLKRRVVFNKYKDQIEALYR
ncbi:MAG TPA: long-chain fatty acid--CoA ligase, partial [Syntrophales bacterium]|nr:long-chain fatty acid--CoA ligase [Syntrophales bacterium]